MNFLSGASDLNTCQKKAVARIAKTLNRPRKKRIEAMQLHLELAYTQAVNLLCEAQSQYKEDPNDILQHQIDLMAEAVSKMYDAGFEMELLNKDALVTIGAGY